MSERIRSFFAVELTEGLRDSLGGIRDRLASDRYDVRWVNTGNLHLTLRFLGEVTQEEIQRLTRAAQGAAAQLAPFEVTVGGLGTFPSRGSPRVIWVGFTPAAPLTELERVLTRELEQVPWPPPDKPFRPHLTLGRVKSGRGRENLRGALADHRDAVAGCLRVERFALVRSDLRPAGPLYTTLGQFALSRAETAT